MFGKKLERKYEESVLSLIFPKVAAVHPPIILQETHAPSAINIRTSAWAFDQRSSTNTYGNCGKTRATEDRWARMPR